VSETQATAAAATSRTLAVAEADAVTALSTADVSTQSGAATAILQIDSSIKMVDAERAKLGAFSNRLEHTVSNLSSMVENTSAARSRIADADFAVESANLAKNQVLQQAGTAMLSQANASTQNVLSLLK
jgi:flagellin